MEVTLNNSKTLKKKKKKKNFSEDQLH